MLRSLFAGISGLRSHQTMMDVTGNNIANVNTAGYKTSQTLFQDTLSQVLTAAGAPQQGTGGTNPAQVGLGVKVAGISGNFSQGAAQLTGRSTDLMISGDGFFNVLKDGESLFTRAGSFSFDANGRLVTSDGAMVQGWAAVNGVMNTNAAVGPVSLPIGTLLAPTATTSVTVSGNLPADTTSVTPLVATITTYDAQGNKVPVSVSFTKVSATSWTATATDGTTTVGPTTINFAASGSTPAPNSLALGGVTIDLAGITSYAGTSTAAATAQDGSAVGSLQSFSFTPDGTLVGVFSNGLRQNLGQIALAGFNNPPGLEKVGNTMFRATVNSGVPQIGTAATGGRGTLSGGALEMSNVDLSQEFTNLIIAQRGFQANSRVITASDEILQDLVNLKR
jgi:flagellar hook protein FlgE